MFRFRLQSVLDVKIMLEGLAKTSLASQQRVLEREKEELLAIRLQKNRLIETLRETGGKRVSLADLVLNTAGVKHCLQCEEAQEGRVAQAAAESDRQREALLAAAQKRKAMEILKAKMGQKHQAHADLLERAAIDEMAIVRHQRRERD